MAARPLAVALTAAMLTVLLPACRASAPPDGGRRLAPEVRRAMVERPDSVVGFLIRTSAPATVAERRALGAEGLVVGSVVGTIVTARGRAALARRLAELPFVVWVELAATIPLSGQ